jgi:hypothetical protein
MANPTGIADDTQNPGDLLDMTPHQRIHENADHGSLIANQKSLRTNGKNANTIE